MYPLNAAIHVRGEPQDFAPRLRAIATDVDVTLRLAELMPLKDVVNAEVAFHTFWVRMTMIFSAIALVLSLVAIYAVTSFAVSRRTREIGVRVALGGSRRRILSSIFAQPLRQLGIGVLAGTMLVGFLVSGGDRLPSTSELLTLTAYTVLMTMVCLIACVVPARRAMAVQPTQALRDS
jgi:ABC-type antimicrobial peptide transport system permease subunit